MECQARCAPAALAWRMIVDYVLLKWTDLTHLARQCHWASIKCFQSLRLPQGGSPLLVYCEANGMNKVKGIGCGNYAACAGDIIDIPPVGGSLFLCQMRRPLRRKGSLPKSSPGVETDTGAERIGGAYELD